MQPLAQGWESSLEMILLLILNWPCEFLTAAVTNHHKGAAKSNTCLFSYSSGGQKSNISLTGLMSRCWQGWFLLETPGENPLPCLFQLLVAPGFPGSWLLSPPSKSIAPVSASVATSPPHVDPPSSLLQGPLLLHWVHLNNSGSSFHLKMLNLITSAKSFLPYKVTLINSGD